MLVCIFVSANRTRDRGCSKHPVFPAPSDFRGAPTMQTSGDQRRENAKLYPPSLRAQRSNPSLRLWPYGLFRFARNDVERVSPRVDPLSLSFRRMGGAQRYPSSHAPALMGIAVLHPSGMVN